MNETAKIRLRDVHKSFGDHHVLKGIDLDVAEAESVVIIGGSGTGKSVTLKCVLGLLKPDRGSIEIDGVETVGLGSAEHDAIRRRIGMLFQGAALFDSLPVWENVAFGLLATHRTDRRRAREIAIETLAQVGIGSDACDFYPAELSGGMKKRVGLARVIATEPEIMLFDEPTTGLDPIMGDVINDLIVKSVKDLGATAITITHDMASARKIADRLAMIHDGRIIWNGTVEEIDQAGEPHVEQFIHGSLEGPIGATMGAA